MREYELQHLPELPDESKDVPLHAFVRGDDGERLGGLLANLFRDGVEIDTLWVAPTSRRSGVGSSLMRAVEDEARRRGAVVAYLKTVMAKDSTSHWGTRSSGSSRTGPSAAASST